MDAMLWWLQAAEKYTEVLPIEINGLFTMRITVAGEGSPLRVEPANPAQSAVHFGGVQAGQTVTRVVQVWHSVALHAVQKM
jgi:hypothetical protein